MKTMIKPNGNLFPAIPSLLEDLMLRGLLDPPNGNWKTNGATLPAVNISESNDAFILEVAAPGLKREDFHVALDNHVLTISSNQETSKEEQTENGLYTRREFSYQAFQRSFALPDNKIDGEKIAAKYVNGILSITVPKKEDAKIKPPKQISIS